MRRAPIGCLLVGAAVAVRLAHASPGDRLGRGPTSQALAGTGSLAREPYSASSLNPAWLARIDRRTLELGWQSTLVRYRYTVEGSEPGWLNDAVSGPLVGVVVPLELGVRAPEVGFGLSAFSPEELVTRARIPFESEPQAPLAVEALQALNLDFGLGIGAGRAWSFGAGVAAQAALVGSIDVSTSAADRVTTDVEDDLELALAPVAGVSFRSELASAFELEISLSARGALESDIELALRVGELGAVALPPVRIAGTAKYDPAQAQLEVALRRGRFAAVIAATFKRWSAFGGWLERTVDCPAGEPVCGTPPPAPVDASDTLVPRIALEHRVAERPDLRLRAGYAFEASPLAEQRGEANRWDNDRHGVSLGWGIRWVTAEQPMRLNLALVAQVLVERRHEKHPEVDSENPGFASVSTEGSLLHGSLTWGLEF